MKRLPSFKQIFGVKEDINSKGGKRLLKILLIKVFRFEHKIYNQAIMEFGAIIPRSPNVKL